MHIYIYECVFVCVEPCYYIALTNTNTYIYECHKLNGSSAYHELNQDVGTRYYNHFVTTQCNPLQHTAIHCNPMQHTSTCCNTLQQTKVGTREYNCAHSAFVTK